ncbi:hypothetical protein LTR53_014997, partial [Teratosphaeriaceae sp. CCFEE 6253]
SKRPISGSYDPLLSTSISTIDVQGDAQSTHQTNGRQVAIRHPKSRRLAAALATVQRAAEEQLVAMVSSLPVPESHDAVLQRFQQSQFVVRRRSWPTYQPETLLAEASERHDRTAAHLAQARNEIDRLATQAQGNETRIRRLSAQLHSAKNHAAFLIALAGTKVVEHEHQLQEMRTAIRVCGSRIKRDMDQRVILRAEVRALEALREKDREALKAVRARAWVPRSFLKKRIAELTLLHNHSEARVRAKMVEVGRLEEEIEELRDEVEVLQSFR